MKKLMIPCLAATLLLGSSVAANEVAATSTNKEDASIKYVHKTEGKKHGLENALERGNKSDRAKEVIKRNIEKQKEHQKWKEEKEKLKKDKKENKHKDKKDKKEKDKKEEKVDLTLNKFTISGVDVSKLSGLTTKEGAVLKVANFKDFTGINVKANGDNAEVVVFLNDSKIHEDYLKNINLRNKDVIVVQVKDGKETKEYKLTLVHANAVALSKFTIGGIDVRSLTGITTKDGATLKVDNFSDFRGIAIQPEDSKAEVTVSLNGNSVNKDLLPNLLLRANDKLIVTVKKGETKQAYTVTLVKADNIALNTFTIGGIDVRSLEGITSKDGATLKVANFDKFNGIVVQPEDKNAVVTVSLNDKTVSNDYFNKLALRANDKLIVTVKQGDREQTYTVKLIEADAHVKYLNTFEIGGESVLALPGLTSESGATLKVDSSFNFKGIKVDPKDNVDVTVHLNGEKVAKDGWAGLLLRIYDVLTVIVTEDKHTEAYKVTLSEK